MDPGLIVGERLFEWRESKGWTQEEMAEKAGVSPTTVTHLENLKVERPRLNTTRKLARALGVSVEEFLGGPNGPKVGAPELGRLTPAARCLLERLVRSKEDPSVYWGVLDIIAVRDEFARIGVSNDVFAGWFEEASLEDLVVDVRPAAAEDVEGLLQERPPVEEEVRRLSRLDA